MKKFGVILSVIVLLLAYSAYAYAEVDTASVNVSLKPKLTISVQPNSVGFGDMEPATSKEIDAANNSYAVQVTVKSNQPWDYTYSAGDFSDGTNSFTVDHLSYKEDAGTTYTNFAANGTLGTNMGRGVNRYNYDYKLTFADTDADWSIPPSDTYSSSITYSAVQP